MSKIGRDGLSVEMDIGRDGKQSRWKSVDMVSVKVETGRGDPTPDGLTTKRRLLTTKRRLLLDEYIKKAYLDFTPLIFDRQDFPFFTPNQKNMVVMD